MDTMRHPTQCAAAPRPETAAAKQRRVAREAKELAVTQASAASGRSVSEARVDAWIDSLGTDDELPPPRAWR